MNFEQGTRWAGVAALQVGRYRSAKQDEDTRYLMGKACLIFSIGYGEWRYYDDALYKVNTEFSNDFLMHC